MTITLEQRYPPGRLLWDIDVLTAEGEILSRRCASRSPLSAVRAKRG